MNYNKNLDMSTGDLIKYTDRVGFEHEAVYLNTELKYNEVIVWLTIISEVYKGEVRWEHFSVVEKTMVKLAKPPPLLQTGLAFFRMVYEQEEPEPYEDLPEEEIII